MDLTEDQRFKIRYYLGYPDLAALPPVESTDVDDIALLQASSELETRMTNIGISAETKLTAILLQLDTAFGDLNSMSSRMPFKRIEDITFRDDEYYLRWSLNANSINSLAAILGIAPHRPLNPGIGLAVV